MGDIIDVKIYGDGSRKYPYKVRTLSCDRANECSLYKEGKCLKIPGFLSPVCPVGDANLVDTVTKYANRCQGVLNRWREHPSYNKLNRPPYAYIALVGDDVLVNVSSVSIDKDLNIRDPGFGGDIVFVPKEKFTAEFVTKLISFRPHAIMGGLIRDYSEKTVPYILRQISELLPKVYEQLDQKYKRLTPNYVGRLAYISTCNPESEFKDVNGIFHIEGDELVCDDWKSAFLPFGSKTSNLRVKLTDSLKVEITDNNQVLPTTKFVY